MESILANALPTGACPHIAMLVSRHDQVAAVLASFYALGARRNGWLIHRSLAGRADKDRAALAAAGLDVTGLEAEGRLAFTEIEPSISVEDYVHASDAEIEAALARGFDAAWCSRFPVGPDAAVLDHSVAFDHAWDAHAHDRAYVSLCIFVVSEFERARRAAQLATIHDAVLTD